ncbi:RNA polymerase III subunit Rpc25-domain-containing protein [Lentinula edodes]|uniref:RNA polymerase III subunit Rpc25-domain-containing protein n=1 Tax=Lentinula edodes TaxID=5353 RepID=UPI001E8E66AB|nr:RNA polymerase III subunit Rpc25-domain-containing protein [Lentinula edodes]KAH7877799.1 RNA polymerase III subunit Rpc25-domain-containing protein [Lentinula edodes]KAJ3898975.1 RNA polymerase III subunit Rpc25-domain-containing protein [Lentinula edodes]KAJ3913854.1 RNA polymerase III subunit Rpc25-domain-containing protein [Lentinula edodes]
MFNLAILKDTVAIHPSNFGVPPEQALIVELNKKYANRILHDVGLCVSVFDLSEVGEGKVRYGDGYLWYKTVFRMVVFRPFTSEVLLGKVKSSDENSIRVSLGFFDDIYIPAIYLPQPSCFDPSERAHFWMPESELTKPHELLDTPTVGRMYIDMGEVVRIRVEADEFYDDEPGPPKALEGVAVAKEARRAPYSIIASIAEQGLGSVSWWNGAGAEEEDAMEES